ncbi:MAG TPA: DUF5985 family protein [Xanthomonadaceae bacterium]|nr:DUF5985 family protein [Xanthomonadaceae bacterium]
MEFVIYALCALTALGCALLLFQAALRTRSRMLFFSAFCFATLTITNLLVLVDHAVGPSIDLRWLRLVTAVVAIGLLLYGLIFEEK